MIKYYANSEEKYLKVIVLYAIQAVGGDTYGLFYDAEGTQQAHNSDYDWAGLFLKGLIRVNTGDSFLYNPYKLSAASEPFLLFLDSGSSFSANFFPDEENGSSGGGGNSK